MANENTNALRLMPPSALAKMGHGPTQIMSGMVSDALTLAILKSKRGTLNSGIDPEVLAAGVTLAGYHIESGARTFSAYAKAMLNDLGNEFRPYLKSFYMALKFDPLGQTLAKDMDSATSVEMFDLDSLDEESIAAIAEKPVAENGDGVANTAEKGNIETDVTNNGESNVYSI